MISPQTDLLVTLASSAKLDRMVRVVNGMADADCRLHSRRHRLESAYSLARTAVIDWSSKMVRKGGLEPPCLLGATPSRWCVCQFHHFRAHNMDGKNPSSSWS